MKEIWRPLTNLNENYLISSTGRVQTLDRLDCKGRRIKGKILSTKTNTHNYESFLINTQGKKKRIYVHRAVAMTFIPNPNNYPQINHKDGNKRNNDVNNLEWCTQLMNNRHAHKMGLCKGFERTDEYKLKVSKIVKNLWEKGVYQNKKTNWTSEKRENARKAQLNSKLKKRGGEHPCAKKVMCLETGEIFSCIKYADDKYGGKAVKSVMANKQKTAYGMHWKII